MSADKYPSIFSRQMEAFVYIFLRQMEVIVFIILQVLFQKRVRGFHSVPKREKTFETTTPSGFMFSSVWKPDETRSTRF